MAHQIIFANATGDRPGLYFTIVGEFPGTEGDHPVFTVADSLIALTQTIERNSIVRKIRVVKMRGQGDLPGLHTFRITRDGLKVFPRLPKPGADPAQADASQAVAPVQGRLSTGVRGLQRYVELDGALKRVMTVVKVRGSDHSTDLRFYEVNSRGITVGDPIRGYHHGLLTADPWSSPEARPRDPTRRDRRERS